MKRQTATWADAPRGWIPAAIFLAAFGYFLYCAVPTLYWGDSAEMVSLSCDMGVAHSPGYPLFTQLTRLFASLPLDPYPFRVNLLSVFLGALGVALFYGIVYELTRSRFAGAVAAAGMVCCRAFVYFSLFAEVYTLHLALFFGAAYLLARQAREGGSLRIYAALMLIFIGSMHHLLMVFALGAAAVYLALLPGHRWRVAAGPLLFLLGAAMINLFRSFDAAPKLTMYAAWTLAGLAAIYAGYLVFLGVKRKGLAGMLAGAGAALLLFAAATLVFGYLPLASARGPLADWWSPKDPVNFLNLLRLQGYESTMPENRLEWMKRLDLSAMGGQFPFLIAWLAIPGIVLLIRKQWRYTVFILLVGAGTFAGSMFVMHGKPEALRLPVFAAVYLFIGAGAAAVPGWRFFSGARWKKAIGVFSVIVIVVFTAISLGNSDWRFMNRSSGAYDLGRRILDEVRSRSLLFIGEQTPSIMGYFKACERDELKRREIAVIPVSFLPFKWELDQLQRQYPMVRFPEIKTSDEKKPVFRVEDPALVRYALKMIEENPGFGVYSDFQFMTQEEGRITLPRGAVYQVVPADTDQARIDEMLERDKTPKWRGVSPRDKTTAENLASVYNERGKIYLDFGMKDGNEKYMRAALKEFNLALRLYPDYAEAMSNKGHCMFFFGQGKKGLALMENAVRKEPTNPRLLESLATVKFRQQTPQSVKEAMAYWEVAFALDPHNARALHNIATALVALKQDEAAVQYYKKAIEIDPDYISPYINLARVYNSMGICQLAVETLEMAKDKRPDMIEIRSELAQQYNDCHMRHLYAQEMDSLMSDFPENLELFYVLAIIFRNVGQFDNFVLAIMEIRKLEPDFPIQKLFTTLDPCERAISALRETIDRMPGEAQLYLTLALRQYSCDMGAEAAATIELAARKFPKEQGFRLLFERMKNPKAAPPAGNALPESPDPYER